jgi:predicted nucleotidyltransferase
MNYSKSFKNIKNTTSYQDINIVLEELSLGLQKILGNNLNGLYLFGSLVYGDFKEGSSDIDLVAIIKKPFNEHELGQVKKLHHVLNEHHPKWQERVECSYTPIHMLVHTLPPEESRPYYGGGIFYADADYGNEWIINNYLLSLHSIALIGPSFHSLVKPIDIIEVQKACIRDLFLEWAPKPNDLKWLENSHYQSYLILNLCRILYTVYCAKTGSKIVSAAWAKEKYPQWQDLIGAAEQWEYGQEMHSLKESINFIQFTITEISKNELCKKINLTDCNVKQMKNQHGEDA